MEIEGLCRSEAREQEDRTRLFGCLVGELRAHSLAMVENRVFAQEQTSQMRTEVNNTPRNN